MLTLSEHSKNLKDDMEAGIVKSWLECYPYLDLFAVKTLPGRTTSWRREETLGTVGKRAINEVWAESTGTTSVQTTTMELLGGYIDLDKELLDEPTYDDEAALQTSMKARTLGFTVCDDLINGTPTRNINEFYGLKALAATLASRQVIDAASLDLSTGAAREANADEAIRILMLGIQRIRAGTGKKPSFILMNDTLSTFLADAFRRADRMTITQDVFDRELATGMEWPFAGIPVYDAGFLADQSTKVISDSHISANNTAAYLVYSSDSTTRLIQKYGVRTTGPRLLDNMIHKRWEVEFCFGVQMRDKFSVCQIKNWKVA